MQVAECIGYDVEPHHKLSTKGKGLPPPLLDPVVKKREKKEEEDETSLEDIKPRFKKPRINHAPSQSLASINSTRVLRSNAGGPSAL